MKNSKAIALLVAFALLLSVTFVSAAIVNPISSQTINGTITVNATNAALPNMLNCTFTGSSSLTANLSFTVGNFFNESANDANINGTFNTRVIEDANDYTFTAACYNTTASTTSSVTNVVVNNTQPSAPSALSPASLTTVTTSGTQTFTSTVVNANTTRCTYSIGRGGISTTSADTTTGSATYAGSTCSFTKTFTGSGASGIWYWQIVASDGTDTASSATSQLTVQIAGNTGGAGASSAQVAAGYSAASRAAQKRNVIIIGGIFLLIAGAIAIFMSVKKR